MATDLTTMKQMTNETDIIEKNKKIWDEEFWPAIERGDFTALGEVLKKYNITIEFHHPHKGTALLTSIREDKINSAIFALEMGADPDLAVTTRKGFGDFQVTPLEMVWEKFQRYIYDTAPAEDMERQLDLKASVAQFIDALVLYKVQKNDLSDSPALSTLEEEIAGNDNALQSFQEDLKTKKKTIEEDLKFCEERDKLLKMQRENITVKFPQLISSTKAGLPNEYADYLSPFNAAMKVFPKEKGEIQQTVLMYIEYDMKQAFLLSRAKLKKPQIIEEASASKGPLLLSATAQTAASIASTISTSTAANESTVATSSIGI